MLLHGAAMLLLLLEVVGICLLFSDARLPFHDGTDLAASSFSLALSLALLPPWLAYFWPVEHRVRLITTIKQCLD